MRACGESASARRVLLRARSFTAMRTHVESWERVPETPLKLTEASWGECPGTRKAEYPREWASTSLSGEVDLRTRSEQVEQALVRQSTRADRLHADVIGARLPMRFDARANGAFVA